MYRASTRPAPALEAAPGELLVPVPADALARQLCVVRAGPEAPMVVSLGGHSGWLLVGWALLLGPRFGFRLVPAGPTSTRVVIAEPALNPLALVLGALACMTTLATLLVTLRDHAVVPILAGGLVTASFWAVAALGRRALGEKHAILAREHLLEQARLVEAAAVPRVRVAASNPELTDLAETAAERARRSAR